MEEYKKFLFEAKNAHNLAKENAHYDFNISKEKVYSQTINEEQREYESIKKSLLKSFKIKLSSLDDSVGLSKDIREQQKVALTQMHQKDLLELEKEYENKITSKAQKITSKRRFQKTNFCTCRTI